MSTMKRVIITYGPCVGQAMEVEEVDGIHEDFVAYVKYYFPTAYSKMTKKIWKELKPLQKGFLIWKATFNRDKDVYDDVEMILGREPVKDIAAHFNKNQSDKRNKKMENHDDKRNKNVSTEKKWVKKEKKHEKKVDEQYKDDSDSSFYSCFKGSELPGTFNVEYGKIDQDTGKIVWYGCTTSRLEWSKKSTFNDRPAIVAIAQVSERNGITIVEKVECTGYVSSGYYKGVYMRHEPNSKENWKRPVFRVWKSKVWQE